MKVLGWKKLLHVFLSAVFLLQIFASTAHFISHHLHIPFRGSEAVHQTIGRSNSASLVDDDDDDDCPLCQGYQLTHNFIAQSPVTLGFFSCEVFQVFVQQSVSVLSFHGDIWARGPPHQPS